MESAKRESEWKKEQNWKNKRKVADCKATRGPGSGCPFPLFMLTTIGGLNCLSSTCVSPWDCNVIPIADLPQVALTACLWRTGRHTDFHFSVEMNGKPVHTNLKSVSWPWKSWKKWASLVPIHFCPQLVVLTLFVQEIGAWPKSHKLRF